MQPSLKWVLIIWQQNCGGLNNINSNNNSYFFLINGKQVGPIQGDAIKNLIENNTINTETITWKIGMANWEKISNVPELLNLYFTTPPPPPNIS